MRENFRPPDQCPSCGSPMHVVNEFGIRKCPRACSGRLWDPVLGWDPTSKEAAHEAAIEKELACYLGERPRKEHALLPWARYLRRSLRAVCDLATANSIIGVTYADGKVAVTIDGMALVTTLEAGVHLFPLPKGTKYIHAGVYSGPVMSAMVPHHTYLDRKYPKVRLFVAGNCSGVNWGYIAFNCSGKPIVPPPLRS